MFSEKDLKQIAEKGIKLSQIEKQIEYFKKGTQFARVVKPATLNQGIKIIEGSELRDCVSLYDEESLDKEVVKFVPASGAATRMFQQLFSFRENYFSHRQGENLLMADQSFYYTYNFFKNFTRFPFYEDLKNALLKDEYEIEKLLSKKDYITILDYLLTEKGLNYGTIPKALILFHRYNEYSRTSLEEHLVEGANYVKDNQNIVRIHFTLSPEHTEKIKNFISSIIAHYEELFNVNYDISYSVQKPSTDTIAVTPKNIPFRDDDGSLLFRPGGHGALLENLNEISADIIFIKNIDNVIPDRFKQETLLYKKVLGGYLIKLQEQIFEYIKILKNKEPSEKILNQIFSFTKNELCIIPPDELNPPYSPFTKGDEGISHIDKDKENNPPNPLYKGGIVDYLLKKLDRPIRVCGMVKNLGEPGGGPFWVKNKDGSVSLQIIESSQINQNSPEQLNIFKSSTHFNPVDIVCSFADYEGNLFDLKDFVDYDMGFITKKSYGGKDLKAYELPGLWNGAMADWNTCFVEVPLITFNPVKNINDLLRDEHQPE